MWGTCSCDVGCTAGWPSVFGQDFSSIPSRRLIVSLLKRRNCDCGSTSYDRDHDQHFDESKSPAVECKSSLAGHSVRLHFQRLQLAIHNTLAETPDVIRVVPRCPLKMRLVSEEGNLQNEKCVVSRTCSIINTCR